MDNQAPLVLDAALRYKRILGPTSQVLSIVLHFRGKGEHTQRLIAHLRELQMSRVRRGVNTN